MRILQGAIIAAALAFGSGAQAATVYATQIDAGRLTGAGWDATTHINTGSRDDAGNALGAPDGVKNVQKGFYSLGLGGAAVFGFGTAFGGTATFFEVTFNCGKGATCSYAESADVYVLSGDYAPSTGAFGLTELLAAGFSKVGSIINGSASKPEGASLTIGGPFTYLALVDTSPWVKKGDGFDVDAIGVTPVPVPVPAAGLLLVGALGGLAAMRRRAKA